MSEPCPFGCTYREYQDVPTGDSPVIHVKCSKIEELVKVEAESADLRQQLSEAQAELATELEKTAYLARMLKKFQDELLATRRAAIANQERAVKAEAELCTATERIKELEAELGPLRAQVFDLTLNSASDRNAFYIATARIKTLETEKEMFRDEQRASEKHALRYAQEAAEWKRRVEEAPVITAYWDDYPPISGMVVASMLDLEQNQSTKVALVALPEGDSK